MFSVSGCHTDYLGSTFDGKQPPMTSSSSQIDVKPTYLVNYGGNNSNSATETKTEYPDSKNEYDPYYSKLSQTGQLKDVPPGLKIPKTESSNSSSCCSVSGSRTDLLVPKSETTSSSCRSSSPSSMRPAYDPYLNQDSNSSSMSSMDTMGPRPMGAPHHHLPHHSVLPQHQNPHQPQPVYSMDERQHQLPHRSPYHQSPMSTEDMYHRPEHLRPYPDMTESGNTGITRPIVTYSNEIAGRAYDSSLINSASHRPYDPGTVTAFERYDPNSQPCGPLQQPIMPQRVPPQNMYPYGSLEEDQRYQQEASAVQQHQMAVATAAAAGMMKTEHSPEQESTGPLYPRYVIYIF